MLCLKMLCVVFTCADAEVVDAVYAIAVALAFNALGAGILKR